MNSITARWMFYVQIVFLALALWLFPFFMTPVKAEPVLTKHVATIGVVLAVGLQDMHGPVEYRPQLHNKVQIFSTPKLVENRNRSRRAYEVSDLKTASYSGNLWAMNAKP
jgi:hypothetical protein